MLAEKTTLECNGSLHPLKGSHPPFHFQVEVHGSCDGADRCRTNAVLIQGCLGCSHHAGVVCQPQVVVGTEIEDAFSVHNQPRTLRRANGSDSVVQSRLFQAADFLVDPIIPVLIIFYLVKRDGMGK